MTRARSLRRMWLTRIGLWAMALVIVAVPVVAIAAVRSRRPAAPAAPAPGPQPPARISDHDRDTWRALGTSLPVTAPPVVLAYHDVRPGPADKYVVAPDLFERQLTALAEAGYRTITSQQYLDYLNGAAPAPRSVFLTFDDGTAGLARYADPVLARLRMHGASFLISQRVGSHQPYYLTWPAVKQMHASGRWDFEGHTHDLHTRGPVGADRADGSLLTGRRWDAATGRLETRAEHSARVSTDLDLMLADFRGQGLPRPRLFAYPFSDLGSRTDDAAVRDTRSTVDGLFAAAFTNRPATPSPTSRRSAATGEAGRIEVLAGTTPDALVRRVAAWTAITPGGLGRAPLADPGRWWDIRTGSVPSLAVLRAGRRPGRATYVQAAYAPFATADWVGYRVDALIDGLDAGRNNANVTVRSGSTAALVVRVSAGRLRVVDEATGRVRADRELRPAARHAVRIEVSAGLTTVRVDAGPADRIRGPVGAAFTGGLAVAARCDAGARLPALRGLTVSAP